MPSETSGRQTLESVELVARQIELITEQIRASAELMRRSPAISAFEAPREKSLETGLVRLQSWADGLRDAIMAAKMETAKAVSDSKTQNGKTKQNK